MVPWLFGKEIEIPEEWEFDKIENFCDKITSGGTPNRSNSEYYQGQIPWIKSGELNNNFISNSEEKITEAGLSNSSAKLFPKNTVLIAMYGATIGKTAITEIESTTNQAICAILPNSKFDSFYLQQLLISMKNILISFGMGAGQPNINQEIIKTFHIIFPPLPEQQKIASILSNVDNLIQNTDKLIEKTTRLKKGLMQKLLTKGIGHTKFKKVKWLFGKEIEIPEEWEVRSLDEILELVIDHRGLTPKKLNSNWSESGIPAISAMNINSGKLVRPEEIRFVDNELFEKWMPEKLKKGDIILTSEAPLGELYFLENGNYCLSQRLFALRGKENSISSKFLFFYLYSTSGQNSLIQKATGTTVKGIRQVELIKIKILLPPLPEQQKIASILSNVDTIIQSKEQYKEKLQRLKKSLMQKLLTGEVRVAV